ncbi:MAG: NUDIX hydrolase [Clostridia bacterium]|nr:NUDIX hydrolase [Clostridia bacterium]
MDEKKELYERYVSGERVYRGTLLDVRKDEIILPDGKPSAREYIRHVGAVCIVPMTGDGRVIAERQFRYPVGEVMTEIPAGKLDGKEENRLSAAKRELREETGFTADEWTFLGDYYPSPAYSDERISMYLARGLHSGERKLDEDEFLNVMTVPLNSLVSDVLSGKITDGKTQAAVLKTAILLKKI